MLSSGLLLKVIICVLIECKEQGLRQGGQAKRLLQSSRRKAIVACNAGGRGRGGGKWSDSGSLPDSNPSPLSYELIHCRRSWVIFPVMSGLLSTISMHALIHTWLNNHLFLPS